MSDPGFLGKLLDGAEVEWVPLGDLCLIKTGPNINKKIIAERPGPYPVINSGREPLGFVDHFNVEDDPIGIASRGSVGLVTWTPNRFFRGNLNYSCTPKDVTKLSKRFMYHFLLFADAEIQALATHQGIPALNAGALKILGVPIPCPEEPEKSLAIQREIVRILDSFTELTAELTAELAARKKQYNHYRDQLLTFQDDDFVWKALGDVSLKSYSGATPKAGSAKYYDGGTIPWLRTQEVVFTEIHETAVKVTQAAVDETAAKWIPENCVIVAISGATAGRSGINKIPLTTNQHCCCLAIDPDQALYRYVFHWVSMNHEKLKELGQGARGDLNSGIIKGFEIPIPFPEDPKRSMVEQARIVEILDKFDTLTTSLSEGLPREIKLRQKQYEYYRDLLLSFPKPAEAIDE